MTGHYDQTSPSPEFVTLWRTLQQHPIAVDDDEHVDDRGVWNVLRSGILFPIWKMHDHRLHGVPVRLVGHKPADVRDEVGDDAGDLVLALGVGEVAHELADELGQTHTDGAARCALEGVFRQGDLDAHAGDVEGGVGLALQDLVPEHEREDDGHGHRAQKVGHRREPEPPGLTNAEGEEQTFTNALKLMISRGLGISLDPEPAGSGISRGLQVGGGAGGEGGSGLEVWVVQRLWGLNKTCRDFISTLCFSRLRHLNPSPDSFKVCVFVCASLSLSLSLSLSHTHTHSLSLHLSRLWFAPVL